jgi:glycosyltransferase involved in cell wall biosynthesis
MIEAMACGTPVLAFGHGSVPEIVDPGVTGTIVSSVDEAVMRLPQTLMLDRRKVRRRFEERFSATRMAKDYLAVYRSLLRHQATAEPSAALHRAPPVLEKEMN